MKNSFFKNRKAQKQQVINQLNLNFETMFKCIEEVCGKDKATEVAELMKKRVKRYECKR